MHDVVDLRSDTLTTPTPAMRAAMAAAEVGDDVWEEDPTVRRLEARAAARFGKEAGLFVASGTMGNQVAHARRLVEGLVGLPGLRVDPAGVQTNIVVFQVDRPDAAAKLVDGCRARKVRIHAVGPTAIRCVTHKDVDADDIEHALSAIREITAGG